MYDHAQHPVFRAFAIGAVFFGTAEVEADHRVFHPVRGFNALRYRVRIWDREFGIGFNRMLNGFG